MTAVKYLHHTPGRLTVHYDPAVHTQADLLAVLENAGCLHAAQTVQTTTAKPAATREGVAGAFGKALVGVLAQRTATRLIGALL